MASILSIHNALLDQLTNISHSTANFYFATRERDTKNRLSEGYWFIGNEHYLQTSFWTGRDWKERIYNIGFCVLGDGRCYLELAAQDNPETAQVLEAIAKHLGGFVRLGKKAKWQKHYQGNDYLTHLKAFISETKPEIDTVLSQWPNTKITAIDQMQFNQRFMKSVSARAQQLDPQLPSKMARVCYNRHGWRYPSGPEGKSESANSYEYVQGFGHEEWLFDFSKTIDGYKYGFVEPLRVESGKHFGKEYDLTLFTRTKDARLLAVATIRNVYCIDNDEAAQVHAIYRKNGWLTDMQEDVAAEGGRWKSFISENPSLLFNFRFQPADVEMLDLREIDPTDPNIRGHRINLRDLKTPLGYVRSVDATNESSLFRSTDPRTRDVEISSTTYDPVHEMMQQALYKYLDRQSNYQEVLYEHECVDLKARTRDNKWHYFEIKTASPRLCLRQAWGQIMEYAYYPKENKCEKLFIIGPQPADEQTIRYLDHITSLFSIPVCYQYFDKERHFLSEPEPR